MNDPSIGRNAVYGADHVPIIGLNTHAICVPTRPYIAPHVTIRKGLTLPFIAAAVALKFRTMTTTLISPARPRTNTCIMIMNGYPAFEVVSVKNRLNGV